jgi:hypothetical protein
VTGAATWKPWINLMLVSSAMTSSPPFETDDVVMGYRLG